MLPLSIAKVHLNIGRVILPIPVDIPLAEIIGTVTGVFPIDLMEVIGNHLKFSDKPTDNTRGLEALRDVIVKDKSVTVIFSYRVEIHPMRLYTFYNAEVETNCDIVKVCLEELLGVDAPLGGIEIANDPTPVALPVGESEKENVSIDWDEIDADNNPPKKFPPAAYVERHSPIDK